MCPAKIFIVEDDASDVYILRRALAEQGEEFELEVAGDGEQALRCVSRLRRSREDSQPAVILLDLHLPKYDGLEVLRAIRQEPVLHGNHVVVMTGSASPQELAELREMG